MSDRAFLQGLIDSAVLTGQRHIQVPAGEYEVDRAGSAWWCLQVPPAGVGLQVHGAGMGSTVIRMAPNSGLSTRVIAVRASDVSIDSLSLLGGEQSGTDEHKAGVFVMAPRTRLAGLGASGFPGDGIYLYAGADGSTVERCLCSGNVRNGITLGATLDGVRVMGSRFIANGAQQFDTEPGAGAVVSRLLVADCLMDAMGASGDYVMTLGGSSAAAPGHDVTVTNCTLNGPTFVVWGERVSITDCGGVNPTAKPGLTVYRSSRDVDVRGCSFDSPHAPIGMLLIGTGSGSCPERITVADTDVTVGSGSLGISMSSVMEVRLSRVSVTRTGDTSAPGAVGIAVRATNPNQDARLVSIDSCSIYGFAGLGISVMGNVWTDASGSKSPARLDRMEVSRTSVVGSAEGMRADDGTGVLRVLELGPGNDFGAVGVSPSTRVVDSD